jgi:hypothetical protein
MFALLALTLAGAALFVVPCLWQTFVLMMLWAWFLVDLGVPHLDFKHAVGVCLAVGVAVGDTIVNKNDDESGTYVMTFVAPAAALAAGWAAH